MNFFDVIVLGIVEGITEFLPISSTGHLILTARWLRLDQTEFLKSFEIAIQLGAILSVLVLYWRELFVVKKVLSRVVVAFIPTVVLGAIFYKLIKSFLFSHEGIILGALLAGGVVLILFEMFHRQQPDACAELSAISVKQAFLIGVCQSLAMIPGVSRSLATILGGLSLGLSRKTIVQFSFLLAIPTMLGATAYDLAKSGWAFTADQFAFLGVGFVVSFLVALAAVKFLIRYVEKHNLICFGVYRILAFVVFVLVLKMR